MHVCVRVCVDATHLKDKLYPRNTNVQCRTTERTMRNLFLEDNEKQYQCKKDFAPTFLHSGLAHLFIDWQKKTFGLFVFGNRYILCFMWNK